MLLKLAISALLEDSISASPVCSLLSLPAQRIRLYARSWVKIWSAQTLRCSCLNAGAEVMIDFINERPGSTSLSDNFFGRFASLFFGLPFEREAIIIIYCVKYLKFVFNA
jgi:hypothetical protein